MPTLKNVVLAVRTTEPSDQVTTTVDCDVAFTETDLHAMRELNQQYTLRCEVFRRELLEQIPVFAFGERKYPPVAGGVTSEEHATFRLSIPLNALHGGLVGRDDLTARVTLIDIDTGWELVQDSERLSIDLVA
jgi:hypothetical protein